ncbi:MAG: ABC transporter permease [Acidimicrobiales bacterium]
MTWRDAVALAATSVRRRMGRAVLTVAAVALAAALLTALLTIAGTAETRVLDQLAKGGPLAGIRVAAAEPDPGEVDQDDPKPGDPKVLDDAARRRITALPDVRSVLPVVSARLYVVAPAEKPGGGTIDPYLATAVGIDLSQPSRLPVTLVAGRLPDPRSTSEVAVTQAWLERYDVERTEAETVLGTELEAASGRLERTSAGREGRGTIRGRWTRLEVVGVVAQEAASGELLLPLSQTQAARRWTESGFDQGRRLDLPRRPTAGCWWWPTGSIGSAPSATASPRSGTPPARPRT